MKAFLVFSCTFAAVVSAGAQAVKIDRCEPASIRSGASTEVTLSGRDLENANLWSSFPAKIERIEEGKSRFRFTTQHRGAGAIRAHSKNGVSDLFFLNSEESRHEAVACEKRTRINEAQKVAVPCMIEGVSLSEGASFYQFSAKGGQSLEILASGVRSAFDGVITIRAAKDGKRLAYVDDTEVFGADPWLEFLPPKDGDYVLELVDSQYRGDLPFQLHVGDTCSHVPQESFHDEAGAAPISVSLPETVYGRILAKGEKDIYRFSVPSGAYLTIAPRAKSIRSPAMPHVKLTNVEGKVLAETPIDAFDERQLRYRFANEEGCFLTVEDAFSRYGDAYRYSLGLSTSAAPFELSIPRQNDKNRPLQDNFLVTPGGRFEIPIQCGRHQFDDAIGLRLESNFEFAVENAEIPNQQGSLNLRVRVPDDVSAGMFESFRVIGAAGPFEEPLRTVHHLMQRNPGASIPDDVDGRLCVRVVESPVTVEISPPEGAPAESSVKVDVKLVWLDEKRKFNTTLRIIGTPDGVETPEKKLKPEDATTVLELKFTKRVGIESMQNLRVQINVDYHQRPLLVESKPFAINTTEADESKN